MREEQVPLGCGAEITRGDFHNSEVATLLCQQFAEVKMRVPAHRLWFIHSEKNLISDFVAFSGNRYSAMHYDLMRACTHISFQHFQAGGKHPAGAATPASVQESHRPLFRRDEVDRNAISDSYQHQLTCCRRGVTVSSLGDCPPGGELIMPEHFIAVNLMRKNCCGKFGEGGAE